MNVGRLTNKRDSTVLKEMLFDPPSGLELTDLYVCVMFARRSLLYPRSSLLLCIASPAVSQACLLATRGVPGVFPELKSQPRRGVDWH
jgi:hypothetical protein